MYFSRYTKTIISRYGSYFRKRNISYVQGQSPEPRVREYFYYIDHQGMLFLDDSKMKNFTSCFKGKCYYSLQEFLDDNVVYMDMLKDKKFLVFFFKRLRPNNTDRYQEFPFISLCGRERNYVRCDDRPVVFTHLVNVGGDAHVLQYAHAGADLAVQFMPEKLCMIPETGRVYHPAPNVIHPLGLVRSKLAIELSKHFTFGNGEDKAPTQFSWNNNVYVTDNKWYLEYFSVT